ncbi:hypothetical protein V5799_010603 [Amblyomma americanum]|uniref:Uncharacterized protein n=1 Tax=Amblyomma americanum TaxID=6943 RepID=A0AAQ4EK89_AMBAM
MDEATQSRWNLLAECIARGFRGFQRSPNVTDPWPNRRPLMQVLLLETAYKVSVVFLIDLKQTATSERETLDQLHVLVMSAEVSGKFSMFDLLHL